MMRKCLIALLCLPLLCRGQVDSLYNRQPDVIRGLDAFSYTMTSPVRWQGKDFATLGGVVAIIASTSLVDEPIRDFWQGKQNGFLNHFERIGNHYGKPYSAVGITGGVYLAGVILKNEWAKETGLMLLSAHASSTVVQTFFKNAVGRARPNLGIGNYESIPFAKGSEYHSFPSGHTTVAFTTSLVMARQVKSVPIKIFFYSMATLTAASRMYLDVHWFSDLAFGGAIAWFCADAAIKRIESNRFGQSMRRRNIRWKVYPYPAGLTVRAQL